VLTKPAGHVRLISTIHERGVTVIPVVPSLAELLVRLAARHPAVLPVRLFTNTGAALTAPMIASLRARFPHASVVPMFGITECKRVSIAEYDGDLLRPGAVGRPLDGTELLITGDDGRPLAAGQVGEIVVRGPHVMSGYWRAPQLTAQRFRRDPVTGVMSLHTGDYGRLDADGYLYFEGRRDDMFKRSGLRVSALEIEAAACDVPGVRAAAVLPPAGTRDAVLFRRHRPGSCRRAAPAQRANRGRQGPVDLPGPGRAAANRQRQDRQASAERGDRSMRWRGDSP